MQLAGVGTEQVSHIFCFDFYPKEPINRGEGVVLLSNNDDIAGRIDALRNQGQFAGDWFSHELHGYNYRLTDPQTALGLAQLRRIK